MSLKDKVLELINNFVNPVEEKFEDVKDQEGNLIRIDKMEKGGKCQLISSDGSLIAMTDGDYTLEDGTVLTIEGSIIKNLTAPTATDEAEAPAENVQPIAQAEESVSEPGVCDGTKKGKPEESIPVDEELVAKVTSMEQEITDIKAAVEQMATILGELTSKTKEFSDVKKKFAKEKEELSAAINKLEKIPAGNPVGVTKPLGVEMSAVKPVAIEKSNRNIRNTEEADNFYNKNVDYTQLYKDMKEIQKSLKNN